MNRPSATRARPTATAATLRREPIRRRAAVTLRRNVPTLLPAAVTAGGATAEAVAVTVAGEALVVMEAAEAVEVAVIARAEEEALTVEAVGAHLTEEEGAAAPTAVVAVIRIANLLLQSLTFSPLDPSSGFSFALCPLLG